MPFLSHLDFWEVSSFYYNSKNSNWKTRLCGITLPSELFCRVNIWALAIPNDSSIFYNASWSNWDILKKNYDGPRMPVTGFIFLQLSMFIKNDFYSNNGLLWHPSKIMGIIIWMNIYPERLWHSPKPFIPYKLSELQLLEILWENIY